MLGINDLVSFFMLFHEYRGQATGASNGIARLSPLKTWFSDITGSSVPDFVHIYVDRNTGTCRSCEAPCGAQLPVLAYSRDCGHNGTIQNLANKIYGDQSYFAVGNFMIY